MQSQTQPQAQQSQQSERAARPLLYSGELPGWVLTGGRAVQATFNEGSLRRDDTVEIMCFDCEHRGHTPFHFLGLECGSCGGFNTSKI